LPVFDPELCDCCGGCAAVCPQNAITVFHNLVDVDKELCNDCLVCKKICPVKAISKKNKVR
jgi:MinD superfamily P-loop ATPase